jgi:hypothetical protein
MSTSENQITITMKRLLTLFIILPALSFSQNSIVIYRTNNIITVGTDSYKILPPNKNGVKPKKDTVATAQTIKNVRNYYFAITGSVSDKTIIAARQSCMEGATIAEVVSLYKEKRTKSFADEMYNVKNNNTEYYRNNISNKYVFSIVFFCIENDTPKAAKIDFYVKDKINGGVSVELNIHKVPGRNNLAPSFLVSGHRDAMNNSEFFSGEMNSNPVKGIEKLLRKQINKTPGSVAFPIQIMQIKQDGVINIPKIYS